MSARKPPASTPTTCGANQIRSATTAAITSSARLMIVEATCQNSRSSPSAYSLNTGTSAALIAPLISRSYKVVGMVDAAVNASTTAPAPNRPAITASRASPSTRLATLPIAISVAAIATRRNSDVVGGPGAAALGGFI